jgi:hypothetical protein
MNSKDVLKEAIDKNEQDLTLNGQPITKEELNKQVETAENQAGVSIQHEGNGQFRRKING